LIFLSQLMIDLIVANQFKEEIMMNMKKNFKI
jgi:hypothetical protein